jgi:hypothetical protein
VARVSDAEGRHQRVLGPAWVRPTTRRTPRGAVVWRAADGPKPDERYLTPRDAEAALRTILEDAPRIVIAPPKGENMSFGECCDAYLRYIEQDRKREASTVADYRNVVRANLISHFGRDRALQREERGRLVDTITTDAIDDYRAELLASDLSHRTAQKVLVLLHGVLQYAKRRGG